MRDVMTMDQVAGILGVGRTMIQTMMDDKRLVGFKIGRVWRFTKADVEATIAALREQGQQEANLTGSSSDGAIP